MTKTVLVALAAGVLGAALFVAAAQGSLLGMAFGTLLSPLPLAMAVLGLGSTVLPIAVVGGAVAAAVLSGTFAVSFAFLLVDVLPVAVLSRLVRADGVPAAGEAIGRWVAVLAVAAMGLMVLGLAVMPIPAGVEGVEAAVKERLSQLIAEAVSAGVLQTSAPPEQIAAMASFLPGLSAWHLCLRGLISVALAQRMMTRLGEAASPTPSYRTISVPGWYIAAFWTTAITAWVTTGDVEYVAMNGASVLCLPLLLQGLAVVHNGVSRFDHRTVWLVAFYALAVLMAALAFVVLVTLGVLEHFLKLRARMAPSGRGG
jgi:uncharacterized protein YybS (DUF2232 family)